MLIYSVFIFRLATVMRFGDGFLCTYTAECCVFSAFNLILLTLVKYEDNTWMIGMSDLKGLIATISCVDLKLPLGIDSEVVSNTLLDYFSQLSWRMFLFHFNSLFHR